MKPMNQKLGRKVISIIGGIILGKQKVENYKNIQGLWV